MSVNISNMQKRSVMSFFVIGFFAVMAALFLVRRGDQAFGEIQRLDNESLGIRRATLAHELSAKEGAAEVDVSRWMVYRNAKYGFTFAYPRELVGKSKGSNVVEVLAGTSRVMLVRILPGTFDVDGMRSVYGKTDAPEITKVGLQEGFRYAVIYGECGGYVIQTPLKNATMEISFTGCLGDRERIDSNPQLMDGILSTFAFKTEN